IVVECDKDGMHVYDNAVNVLTNNPPFPTQMFCLNNYMSLSPKPPTVGFSDKVSFDKYSRGMGALGLPGDLSSQSRFVRAAFTALNSPACDSCEKSVSQFFHILGTVDQTRGCCILDNGHCETTIYTTCFNVTKGILYYTSYDNRQISAVDMNKVNLDGTALVRYPMIKGEHILMQN
ncbi:MAG: linear amide C-N hydrolase, partial [Clostridiales bacterium]|nr:linear amide C-N hydrolase [Clostridiales bacterium]